MDHLKPTELYLGLESGFYSHQEVIRWADAYIATRDYDDDVANISLSTSKSSKEVLSLLGKLARPECCVPAMRAVLGRMSIELERDENVARQIVQYCERFWVTQDYDLPKDMNFMAAAADEFYLANRGVYGTKAEAIERLKNDLERFRKYAGQGAQPDAFGAGWL